MSERERDGEGERERKRSSSTGEEEGKEKEERKRKKKKKKGRRKRRERKEVAWPWGRGLGRAPAGGEAPAWLGCGLWPGLVAGCPPFWVAQIEREVREREGLERERKCKRDRKRE